MNCGALRPPVLFSSHFNRRMPPREEGAFDRLEAFASENGARFYGLRLNCFAGSTLN